MLPPEKAWELLEPYLAPLEPEVVARHQAAGRVLTEDLAARANVPPYDVSAMDGYALGSAAAGGASLPVRGLAAAGDPPGGRLEPGTAWRIMTGAPVPEGADRIVPIEATDGGEDQVTLDTPPPAGAHIRRAGEVLEEGDELLAAGAVLTPAALALLASQGLRTVPTRRSPRLAFLTTGDEVVLPDSEPAPGQLRDSHADFILAAAHGLGLEPQMLGIAPDDPPRLRELIERGLAADLLLLSGGVSKGAFDHVRQSLEQLGCETLFHGVAIQPGKPLLAARRDDTLILGLPGNPASVQCAFWLFARPILRRLAGHRDGFWHGAVAARLVTALPEGSDRDRFLPAEVRLASGVLEARPLRPVGSHDLAAWAGGAALVRVRRGAAPAAAGDGCELLRIG